MKCGHCKAVDVDIAHVRSHTESTAAVDAPNWSAPKPAVQDEALDAPHTDSPRPWEPGDPLPFPPGRYAILDEAEDPVAYSYVDRQDLVKPRERSVRFFKIDAPDEGRWKGYVFVSRQASDDLYPIKHPSDKARIINRIIQDGWKECLLLYGREIGKCGHCGRTLTNDESRAYGIGPVCRRDAVFAQF